MNSFKQLLAVFLMLPVAIGISYFLPGGWVENFVIVLLSAALLILPVMAILFIVSTIAAAFGGGGIRKR